MSNLSSLTHFILCQTQSSANIGSAARALSVMGFEHLSLCQQECSINEETYRLACHAHCLVDKIQVYEKLSQALRPGDYVVGLSNRARFKGPKTHTLAQGVHKIQESFVQSQAQRIILLFGSESSGLSNDELSLCNELWTIETFNKRYGSLNLAQAVQVVSYVLAQSFSTPSSLENNLITSKGSQKAPLSYDPLESLVLSLVSSDKMASFMKKTTEKHTKKRFLNILKNGIKKDSDLKFMMGFLRTLETVRS